MSYYPVMLDLHGKRCVVVGGGTIARHKVDALREAGAAVTVIAPEVLPMPAGVDVMHRAFQPDDVDGASFVIAATDRPEVNAAVAEACEARGIWVNVVDEPALCSVILPSVVRRGAFVLAVSTGGASPTLARRLRERLEREFGPEYGELIELLSALRREWEPRAKAVHLPTPRRKHAWEQVLDLPLLDWLRAGDRDAARSAAREILDSVLNEG